MPSLAESAPRPLQVTPRKPLALSANPLLANGTAATARPTEAKIKDDFRRLPHLATDLKFNRREAKARTVDARQAKSAADSLDNRLPDPDETIHLVLSGRHSLGDYIVAAHALAGQLAELRILTLGFSRRNVAKWCQMIDADQIGTLSLIFSHYFRSTSAELATLADEEFAKRPGKMRLLSLRSHAKILLMRFNDGRRVTFSSSANARSCDNIEQVEVFGDAAVHAFHTTWTDALFTEAGKVL